MTANKNPDTMNNAEQKVMQRDLDADRPLDETSLDGVAGGRMIERGTSKIVLQNTKCYVEEYT